MGRQFIRYTKTLAILFIAGLMGYGCKEAAHTPIDKSFALLRVMWNGDAVTEATIGWSSLDDDASEQRIYLDTIDHGDNLEDYRYSVPVTITNDSMDMYNNFVRLTNLQPGTKYYFLIYNGEKQSRRYWFETSPINKKVSLIAGGDSRNNEEIRMAGNKLVAKLRAHAVIFGGDYTFSGSANQWKRWLQDWQLSIHEDGRITPIVAARGNHEGDNEMIEDIFDVAQGAYFATQIGGNLLRVYTLNSEISIAGDQTDWLKQDLATHGNNSVWKMAQYHQAMSPHTAGKKEREKIYAYWSPLFYNYGVDLISESDSHTMKTTYPIRPTLAEGNDHGFVRDDANGSIYIGEGCWGAPLRDADDLKDWTRESGKINHFHWITFDSSTMAIRTVMIPENVENVGSSTDESRFRAPANLPLYTYKNGPIITRQK